MKILIISIYFSPADVYGGPVRSIKEFAEGLVRSGVDVTVFTTDANGSRRLNVPLCQSINMDGIKVFYFPLSLNGLGNFYSSKLVKELEDRIASFDLVITNALYSLLFYNIIKFGRKHGVPIVLQINGQLLPWALAYKKWKKKLFFNLIGYRLINNVSALQCASEMEEREIKKLNIKPVTLLIPHSINISQYQNLSRSGEWRNRFGIKDHDFILLFLARLHSVKRPDIALEVLGNLKREDVHIIFAGPDECGYQKNLQYRARQLGCSSRVHFTGLIPKNDIPSILADADLLIMPSESENFGMAALEAMAARLPVLVSENVPVGIIASMNGAGNYSTLDVKSFTNLLEEMLSDKNTLKKMGLEGFELVSTQFAPQFVTQKAISEYKKIISLKEGKFDE